MSLCWLEVCFCHTKREEKVDGKVDDLHGGEEGEAGQEPHRAADETKLGFQCHFLIPVYLVVGRRLEVDLNKL